MSQYFPLLADDKLSHLPRHLAHRFNASQMMRWDGPPNVEVDGECPWSWLAAVPTNQAVTP